MKNSRPTEKILAKVLAKITPKQAEKTGQEKLAQSLIKKIMAIKGGHVKAELAGSLARQTHLAGDNDLDIFVFYPEEMNREDFEKNGLALAKKVFKGHKYEIAYSEHPYVRGEIHGHEVEIVPTYLVKDASQLRSAVDRSPFHSTYILQSFGEGMNSQARLLKQFMKGVKCYGADSSSNSFPGYVAELLVLKYGGFLRAIEACANWKMRQVVDIEGYYQESEALAKFKTHLVVIDPVDRNRNVAAALSENQYARFIAACRAFEQSPSENFFFPKDHKEWPAKKLSEFLGKTDVLALRLAYPKGLLEDQAWGQMRRLTKKIASLLGQQDFVVERSSEWVEKGRMLIAVFELEALELQKAKLRTGPHVTYAQNSEAFICAHAKPLSGPRIENGRWIVEIEREFTRADECTAAMLVKIKKEEKGALRAALLQAKILNEKEIAKTYKKNRGFAQFLTGFLKGREEFLDY